MESTLFVFLVTFVLTIALMVMTWFYAVKINNFGIVDAVWSYSFAIHGLIFFFLIDGYVLRKLLLLSMLVFWSFRLGYFLTLRIKSHHPVEDTRYVQLRQEYGANYKTRFLYFFIFQALSVSLLSLPFIFAFSNTEPHLKGIEYAGLVVWLIAVIGETISDQQMTAFRSKQENKGKVCNVGLWKYSRHPNYFFESLIWWGFFITCLGTSGLVWAIYAPLTILFLLLKVTGVPPSEAQSLKSRGEAYRQYQQKTSVFIPWFPKK